MKASYVIALFIFLISGCRKISESSAVRDMAPAMEPGSCAIGKWSKSSLPLKLSLSFEFLFDLDHNASSFELNPIEQMAKVWNDAVIENTLFFKFPFSTSPETGSKFLDNFRDSELGIYKSHEWFNEIDSSVLAITQFYGTVESSAGLGTYINLIHADIIFNYRDYGDKFTYNVKAPGFDVPTILLHEMGHLLGLCHEKKNDSIMAPYYSSMQRNLKPFDSAKIKALYLDNRNYGASKPGTNRGALSDPVGSEVHGVVELHSSGICKHYIKKRLIHQHAWQ